MPSATAHAPCTVGNFGPGFDVLSLALGRRGDRVTIEVADTDHIETTGPGAHEIPTDWKANCATRAIDHLREHTGVDEALAVSVLKGVPPGSGLGSSASSAAAAVRAFARLFPGANIDPGLALDAAAAGEAAASPGHRDDVGAALFGGLVIVGPAAREFRIVRTPAALRLAVVRPDVKLETRRMRKVLPAAIPIADVVANLGAVARLVDACHRDDVRDLGRAVDDDHIARPARSPHVPGFVEARDAALKAGGHGCCISGSGPASLAVCTAGSEPRVLEAMLGAYRHLRVAAEGFVCGVNVEVDDAIRRA